MKHPLSPTTDLGGQPIDGQAALGTPRPAHIERSAGRDGSGATGTLRETPERSGDGSAPPDAVADSAMTRNVPLQAAGIQRAGQRPGIHLEVITQEALPLGSDDGAQVPDLLLVHGAWHGAWCWTRMQAASALVGLRSHAMSLRGHGGSTGHERLARTHLDEYVADVAHVARELGGPFVLLGHSLGGLVAQRYLAHLEQGRDLPRPDGIGLLATALPDDMASILQSPTITQHFGGRLGMLRTMLRMQLTGNATALVGSPELVRLLFFTPDTPEQDVVDCFIRLQNESITVFREIRRLARTWQMPLGDSMPMLVLGGAHDACFSPAILRRLASAHGAALHIFAGMGHDLMLDHGWEQVADAVAAWVRGLPAAGEGAPERLVPSPGTTQHLLPLRPLLELPAPQTEHTN